MASYGQRKIQAVVNIFCCVSGNGSYWLKRRPNVLIGQKIFCSTSFPNTLISITFMGMNSHAQFGKYSIILFWQVFQYTCSVWQVFYFGKYSSILLLYVILYMLCYIIILLLYVIYMYSIYYMSMLYLNNLNQKNLDWFGITG